jgi:conjugative relaxase-like TrwC/TraI family protein
VQTTHKIPGTSATSWSRYLVAQASRGDYYTRDEQHGQSVATRWHGPEQLLRSYGIDPEKAVELRHLRPLMQGFSPIDGEPIRPAGSNRTRVAAIDLTYSPPKDVSALWATADSYRRAQIEVAHRRAVESILQRTEREVVLVRRKRDRAVRFEKAKRLLAVEALHTSSRLGKGQDSHGIPDPQLHSHVAVIAAERDDGKLAAVESKQLFLAARESGAWYRSELAANLQELGLGIERRQGNNERYFAIHGVSKALSEHWSSRSEDVHRAARLFRQRYGREPRPGELDSLTLGTRGSKSAAPATDVNAAWRALGAEHDQTAARTEEIFNDWGAHDEPDVELANELLAQVTKERSMITERELRAKAYELSAGVCRPADADRLIDELAQAGALLKLQDGSWTTRELRETEQRTIDIAQRRASEDAAPVNERSLKQARREIGREIMASLTQEQRDALQTITATGGVSVLVGRAGTGKGVVISAAARAWQLEGNQVIGTAIAGSRAQQLKDEAKLDHAYTTDGLLNGIEKGHIRLGANTVVVMDEAAMSDSDRFARLTRLTAQANAKVLYVGDAAQISSIGAGGLFSALEGKVPTAELTEVHRAHHEWERKAWEQIRNGEPGPALAQYQAHDRLHIHDTRTQAAEAMVANWDETRKRLPDRQAVMITDASNLERDQMNAMAQQRRAQAGELGAHHVELPGKPYGLASGDEVIFSAQFHIPGAKRVENGIAGTIIDTSHREHRVTIKTREREPREVQVDTAEFSELSLAYAVHVNKGQGITAETSGILMGGWQTDREHAYVAVSRAREQTQIYLSREDLGEAGMDTGAIERLGDRMRRSRAQDATITKKLAERDDDTIYHGPLNQPTQERAQDAFSELVEQTHPGKAPAPIDIHQATPAQVRVNVQDAGDIRLAYSQVYDLQGYTGEPTVALFGGWQTDSEQGFATVTRTPEGTEVRISTEDRGERDIEAELTDRVGEVIEHSHFQAADTPEPTQDRVAQVELGEQDTVNQAQHADRDPYIDQAIQEQQDQQQAWEHDIDTDRDNDRGFGIE